jgi:hypothetical protein
MLQRGLKIGLFYWSGCGWLWASVERIEQQGFHSFESFKRQQGERWPKSLTEMRFLESCQVFKKDFLGENCSTV